MTKLNWDAAGERKYETGVSNGALYVAVGGAYPLGVPWNGLVSVTESPSGAEANPFYANNAKYLELRSAEEFAGTIEAFIFPDEFNACDGSVAIAEGIMAGQQERKTFGLAYLTIIGNDVDKNDHGQKLHIVYGATASPSEKAFSTVNESPEPVTFSWEFTTVPVPIPGHRPSATLTISSLDVSEAAWTALMDALYGSTTETAHLPLPTEIITIVETADAAG